MGYRSDVYIKIKKIDKKKFIELLKEKDLLDAFEEKEWNTETPDEYVRFRGNHLKWYSRYDDVKKINSFINASGDRGLIAIGEDDATIYQGNPSNIDMFSIVEVEW